MEATIEFNKLQRETLASLEACINRMTEAGSIALKERAFGIADNLMKQAASCDGLRAQVAGSIQSDERPLAKPVVASGHEPTTLKA